MTPPAPAPARPHWSNTTLFALTIALPVFGWVARPYGCAWGTNAYAYAGLGLIGLGLFLPWFRRDLAWLQRLQHAVAWGFISLVAAVGGLFAANLPLFCP